MPIEHRDNKGLIAIVADEPRTGKARDKCLNRLERKGVKISENVRKWLHVHHIDFDRCNDKHSNLRPMHKINHRRIHVDGWL